MFKSLRSITRLLIGGMVLGYDELQNRMKTWEQQVTETEHPIKSEEPSMSTSKPDTPIQVIPYSSEKQKLDSLGYLIVGLTFKIQEQLEARMRNAAGISQLIGNVTRPIHHNRAIMPMRNLFDNLVVRGQQEVDRWIEIGQRETVHSRALAETAIHQSMDSSIEYLANDPQVEELIQTQSVSLLDEIMEEVRERTFSADDFLEGFIRHTLRLPSRSELPPPPPELKKHAIPSRVIKGRKLYR